MTKFKLILCSILFSGSFLFSQDNFDGSVTWGTPIDLAKGTFGPNGIGVANGDFYATKFAKKKTYLQIYDAKSLSLKKESEIVMLYKTLKIVPVSYFVFGDKLIMVSSFKDKKAKKMTYYLHELEANGSFGKTIELAKFKLTKTPIIFGTVKNMEELRNSPMMSFNYIISEDKNKMMVFHKTEDQKDPKSLSMETTLLDGDLNEEASGQMIIPFEFLTLNQIRISNDGVLHALGYDMIESEEGLKKRKVYTVNDYYLFTYDPKENFYDQLPIEIEKDIVNSSLKVFEDGTLLVYGMFKNEESTGANGTFFLKINNELSVDFVTLDEFEEDFISKHMTEKQKAKAEKKGEEVGVQNYYIHELVVKENGEYVILTEQFDYWVTSHTTYVNGKASTTYTYHYVYGNIITSGCTPTGELTSRQLINKYQHTTNDGGFNSSFFTMVKGNTIYLIYNGKEAEMEDADEAETRKEKKQAKRKTVAAIVEITEDGEVSKKTLFNFEGDESRILAPRQCEKISNTEVFLYARMDKNTTILGKMEIE